MGIPVEDLIFQLNEDFETAKKNFAFSPRKNLAAFGEDGADFQFTLTKDVFNRAQEGPVAQIISKLDESFAEHKPKVLLVAGGFKNSSYLQQRLRAKCEANGISIINLTSGE